MDEKIRLITEFYMPESKTFECGMEECTKRFLIKTKYPDASKMMRDDHLKDAHTCGYCFDDTIFETKEQRYLHRKSCIAYNLLKINNNLIDDEKASSQTMRRKTLSVFLENDPYYLFQDNFNKQQLLLHEKNQKRKGEEQCVFLVFNTVPERRVIFPASNILADDRFTRLSTDNFQMLNIT